MEFAKPAATGAAPAQWFTGEVWWDAVHPGGAPGRTRANLVRFAPGARTHWHAHALGQSLHVVSGTALIGTRDGVVIEARPGELVICPPGEEHWHGAAPDRSMEHLATWEGTEDGSPETTWLEPVTEEQYALARSTSA
ncbi:cupin domain-containing protein [Kitasatospora sp. NPDC094019]|uniref:(R)-mandelonitrile lyase n=1 Tax=Kitasatospora sp. NPDC094019 TaxID=3364091 RepID=UPI003816A9CC